MRTALIAIFFILIPGMAWVLTYGLMGGFDKEPALTTMPNPITTEPTPTPTTHTYTYTYTYTDANIGAYIPELFLCSHYHRGIGSSDWLQSI